MLTTAHIRFPNTRVRPDAGRDSLLLETGLASRSAPRQIHGCVVGWYPAALLLHFLYLQLSSFKCTAVLIKSSIDRIDSSSPKLCGVFSAGRTEPLALSLWSAEGRLLALARLCKLPTNAAVTSQHDMFIARAACYRVAPTSGKDACL